MQGSSAAVVNRSLVDGVQSDAQAPLKSVESTDCPGSFHSFIKMHLKVFVRQD